MFNKPVSSVERLAAGLNKIILVQPAAPVDCFEGVLYVGDVTDRFFPAELVDYLRDLGFEVYKDRMTFKTGQKEN